MVARSSTGFFADLPVRDLPLRELLRSQDLFASVPLDWHVILTDIKGSTQAFGAGRHEAVNLVAAGSIIAVLNLAKRAGTEVPFFFGGDGATLLAPESLLRDSLAALWEHQDNARRNFELELRVGSVPVTELVDRGHETRIARVQFSELFSIPVVLGTGLSAAEKILKDEEKDWAPDVAAESALDLTGMECRWDRVRPEGPTHEVVSLLVTAAPGVPQGATYQRVIGHVDDIYGPPAARNPVSTPELRLSTRKLGLETRTRLGRLSIAYLAKHWLFVQIGRVWWVRGRTGRSYMNDLVQLTDTLVIDGRINTVIAGTPDQRRRLTAALSELEEERLITFGMFVSRESIMSCYVEDRDAKHVHFVDGSDGGYTLAATMLKKKLAKIG